MKANDIDAALLEAWAVDYLARFASSAANLRRVLSRRARRRAPLDREAGRRVDRMIETLVSLFEQRGLIDDRAFAEARARALSRRGASLAAVRLKLRAKGIAPELAAAALLALQGERGEDDLDLTAALAYARRRRLGPYRRTAADRMKELAVFARAGFARPVAEKVLACKDRQAAEALARGLG